MSRNMQSGLSLIHENDDLFWSDLSSLESDVISDDPGDDYIKFSKDRSGSYQDDAMREEVGGDWINPDIKNACFHYRVVDHGLYHVRHNALDAYYEVPIKPGPGRPPLPLITTSIEFEETYEDVQKRRKKVPDAIDGEDRARPKRKTTRSGRRILQRKDEGPHHDPKFTDSKGWANRDIQILLVDPFAFKDKKISQKTLDSIMRNYMEIHPPLVVKEDGYLVIENTRPQGWTRKSTKQSNRHLELSAPKYLLFRSASNAISTRLQANLLSLVQFLCIGDGDAFTGIRVHIKNNLNRSTFHAPHLSVWGHYARDEKGPNGIRLSLDTKNQKHYSLSDGIKKFQTLVQAELAPLLLRYLRVFDPEVYQFQLLIRQRIATFLQEEMTEWGCDYGGVFFTMALSRGASKMIHTDNNDYDKSYAFLIPLGNYEGGGLTLPNCHRTIPFIPGQFLAFSSNLLPHYVEEVVGVRYVITGFTDKYVAARSRMVLTTLGHKVSELNFI